MVAQQKMKDNQKENQFIPSSSSTPALVNHWNSRQTRTRNTSEVSQSGGIPGESVQWNGVLQPRRRRMPEIPSGRRKIELPAAEPISRRGRHHSPQQSRQHDLLQSKSSMTYSQLQTTYTVKNGRHVINMHDEHMDSLDASDATLRPTYEQWLSSLNNRDTRRSNAPRQLNDSVACKVPSLVPQIDQSLSGSSNLYSGLHQSSMMGTPRGNQQLSRASNIVPNRNRSASLGRTLQQRPYQANPLESFSEQYSQLSQIRPDAEFEDGSIAYEAASRRPRLEHPAMRRLAHAALVSSYLAEEIEAENAERLRQRRDTE